MNNYIFLIFIISLSCQAKVVEKERSFIVNSEKKAKKQSVPKIKERIGESYERIAKSSSRMICKLSQANTALIDGTSELLNGECGSHLADLKAYAARLAQIEIDLANCEQSIDTASRILEQRVLAQP